MNPITIARNQNLMNEKELKLGYTNTLSSWHKQYQNSAWIFVGGLHYDLTEGDVICVFSQYGEVVNINLVRDKKTGVSKGFAFLCYEDQRSTVLATDNLNGIKLAGRTIRVDHVEKYRVPMDGNILVYDSDKTTRPQNNTDSVADYVKEHGCGPDAMKHIVKLQKEEKESERVRNLERKRKHEHHERYSSGETHRREDREPHSSPSRRSRKHKVEPSERFRNPSPFSVHPVHIKKEPVSPPDFKRLSQN